MTRQDASKTATTAPLLRLTGMAKRFGSVTVLHGVDLEVRSGEVHALVGENGAGKSTLMHIVGGVHRPDHGRIDFAGQENIRFASAHEAQARGIAIVYQERSLFPHLSVAENIFAGRQDTTRWGHIAAARMAARTRAILSKMEIDVAPETLVADLAPDQQQMVEVAKALSLGARLLILDEPTAALTAAETTTLFRAIAQLRAQGVAVIYISHRLEEIFRIADRVTVLRDGRGEGTFAVAETTPDLLVRKMVGRDLVPHRRSVTPARGTAVLEVRNLSDVPGDRTARTQLRDISFEVYPGELLGLAGLAGAGRTETALSIIGARPRASGQIRIAGKSVDIKNPSDAIEAGIGYLPEERKTDGLFPELDLVDNMIAAGLPQFGTWWMDRAGAERFFDESRAQLQLSCRDSRQAIFELSGGNQQKCLLARWLLLRPRILILDEPTRGVDVAAKAEVHALLSRLCQQGTAVIVISSELPEILAISDRILVLRRGRIAGELPGSASEEDVMRLASLDPSAD